MTDSIKKLKRKEFKETHGNENHMVNAFDDKLQMFAEFRNFHLTEQSGSVLHDLLQIVLHFENDVSIIRRPKKDRQLRLFDFRDLDNKNYGVDVIKVDHDEHEYAEPFVVQYFTFLFLLIQYILDYGIIISKHSLKFKLPKCLDYLEKSIKSTQLAMVRYDVDWYPVFVHWLHILRLKYFIRSINQHSHSRSQSNSSKPKHSSKQSLNRSYKLIESQATQLLQNCKKSRILDENWKCMLTNTAGRMINYAVKKNLLLDCDFELARVLIGKPSSRLRRLICHKIDDKIFTNLNKVSKKRKYFCLMKRFELVKNYGSIRGCNYIKKIKHAVGKSKFKNVIRLLVFLGLSKYGLSNNENDGHLLVLVHPFALANLCSLKQCENCLVKFVKLHRCMIDDETMFFCSRKCEYAIWERLNRYK